MRADKDGASRPQDPSTPSPETTLVARSSARIRSVEARGILDSRGTPTVEVDVTLECGRVGRASVPSGASLGAHEAVELRDRDARYFGKGVQGAIHSVKHDIAPLLVFKDVRDQTEIDEALEELDGTLRKEALGANAILAVSLAIARASALVQRRPLYHALGGSRGHLLPLPLFNLISGGAHADDSLDVEELMVVPIVARSFREALRVGAEVYHALKSLLRRRGLGTGTGDEGGFAPNLQSDVAAIELVLEAVAAAGYKPGVDVVLALDVAATRLFDGDRYRFIRGERLARTAEQVVRLYEDWVRQYSVASIEDGMAEQDLVGWRLLTERLGDRVQLVGDDVFATHETLLYEGIRNGIANAVLIQLNQVGTLTEAIATIGVARAANYATVVSHRSGETCDDFIADFAVATGAGQIKAGAPSRECNAKYNQLLRIEEHLGEKSRFAGRKAIEPGRRTT